MPKLKPKTPTNICAPQTVAHALGLTPCIGARATLRNHARACTLLWREIARMGEICCRSVFAAPLGAPCFMRWAALCCCILRVLLLLKRAACHRPPPWHTQQRSAAKRTGPQRARFLCEPTFLASAISWNQSAPRARCEITTRNVACDCG